ncbi:hypothetical protein KY363_06235, partial [Candidatus Woesearchaeota archaeon]|nr:hypothetical protein [Candidatus Woesearchaeota archaeon]
NNIVNMGGMTLAGLASIGASRNTTWEHNTVTGTASYGLLSRSLVNIIGAFNTAGAPSNNRFANNDLKGFKASIAQAGLRQSWNANYAIVSPSSTTLTNNNYGELAEGGKAGAVIDGSGHKLTNENFWGVYPGLVIPPESSQPCLYLTENSSNVTVTALKNGQVINGITVCNQIVDMNVEMSGATTNLIAGIEKCDRIDYQSLQVLKDRIEGAHQAPPDLSQVDLSNLPPSYP